MVRAWVLVLTKLKGVYAVTKSKLLFLVSPAEEEHPYHQKYEPHVEMVAGLETWMWMDVFTK